MRKTVSLYFHTYFLCIYVFLKPPWLLWTSTAASRRGLLPCLRVQPLDWIWRRTRKSTLEACPPLETTGTRLIKENETFFFYILLILLMYFGKIWNVKKNNVPHVQLWAHQLSGDVGPAGYPLLAFVCVTNLSVHLIWHHRLFKQDHTYCPSRSSSNVDSKA